MLNPFYPSKKLNEFIIAYVNTKNEVEKNKLWDEINTPLIEDIPDDRTHQYVTFLYRFEDINSAKTPVTYLYSSILELPFSKDSQFIPIPETDIGYLTLKLPNTLRAAYNIVTVDIDLPGDEALDAISPIGQSPILPKFTGEVNKANAKLMFLYEAKKLGLDPKNKLKAYDINGADEYIEMESVFELSMAPKDNFSPSTIEQVKAERDLLRKNGRFIECDLDFSDTCLKNLDDYKNENSDSLTKSTRKYWIYLPPEYEKATEAEYPFILFLDGSSYLNAIPAPSILERMMTEKMIPPTIAVFFEYSMTDRFSEYYCHDQFTEFLANEFVPLLRHKKHLKIANSPALSTIVGLSASGLAAFYAGLRYPTLFGNVIAQSASFWAKKQTELEDIIFENSLKINASFFNLEAGSYENTPTEYQFPDDAKENLSLLQAVKNVHNSLNKQGIPVVFHEFVGGHNYLCWKTSLSTRLKEVYHHRK
ncbi:MAG: enterochelin esterase [Legionellales bacterium]|nr:enterochelin esterase [Legionellales bacterium]